MYGIGLLKGLGVTGKHWFKREITEQYPEQRPDLPPASQGFFDYDVTKCIACGLCERACPNHVITVESEKNEEGKKENVTPDDITKQETDIDPDLTPEDWTTGNEEDIEIGTKEDFITPGGQANDWQQGEDEQVTFDSTNLQFR